MPFFDSAAVDADAAGAGVVGEWPLLVDEVGDLGALFGGERGWEVGRPAAGAGLGGLGSSGEGEIELDGRR